MARLKGKRTPSNPIGSQESIEGPSRLEPAQKVKELLRLAQEQGYLTYGDINDALPEGLVGQEVLDEIYVKLRNLEIEIVDQAEVDRLKQPELEDDDEKYGWIFWTIPSGCICGRWARFRC